MMLIIIYSRMTDFEFDDCRQDIDELLMLVVYNTIFGHSVTVYIWEMNDFF